MVIKIKDIANKAVAIEKKVIALRNKLFFGRKLTTANKKKISKKLVIMLNQLDELNEMCKKEGE